MVTPAIDGFDALHEIAAGGHGTVYRARQVSLDRQVALKVLKVDAVDQRPRDLLLREARITGAMSAHPNIVTVYDTTFTVDNRLCLVMEWFSGGTLHDEVEQAGPLSQGRLLDVGIKLASALDVAHGHGVLHRDVKPGNVLLSAYGQPALADFGTATLTSDTSANGDRHNFTLHYAAPEVLDDGPLTPATDVYALGATLYYAASARRPFDTKPPPTNEQLLARILAQQPHPLDLDLDRPRIDVGLSDLIVRMLAKDPDRRPRSARAVADELRQIQAELGLDATPIVSPAVHVIEGGHAGGGDNTTDNPGLLGANTAVVPQTNPAVRLAIAAAGTPAAGIPTAGAAATPDLVSRGLDERRGRRRRTVLGLSVAAGLLVAVLGSAVAVGVLRSSSAADGEAAAGPVAQIVDTDAGPDARTGNGNANDGVSGGGDTNGRDLGVTPPNIDDAPDEAAVLSAATSEEADSSAPAETLSETAPEGDDQAQGALDDTPIDSSPPEPDQIGGTESGPGIGSSARSEGAGGLSNRTGADEVTPPFTTTTAPSNPGSPVDCSTWYVPVRSEQVAGYELTTTAIYNLRRAPLNDDACKRDVFLPDGSTITVTAERSGGWRYIADGLTGELGWVHESAFAADNPTTTAPTPVCDTWYLPIRSEQVSPYEITTTASYNVRRAPLPNEACQRGQMLPAGATVLILAERGEWRYMNDPLTNDLGWIHTSIIG